MGIRPFSSHSGGMVNELLGPDAYETVRKVAQHLEDIEALNEAVDNLEDGRSVELQVTATHIQWRYVPNVTDPTPAWVNLIALASLEGPPGLNGANIALRVNGTNIEWSVAGTETWNILVPLANITGPAGIEHRGVWDGVTSYVTRDVVRHGSNNDLWRALRPNTNVTPVEGADWTLFLPGPAVSDGSLEEVKLAGSLSSRLPNACSTRILLKAIDTTRYSVAYLSEVGREGEFVFRAGDYSAQVTVDPQEGLYIKADTIATTAGAWVRVYDGPAFLEWFGGAADGATTNTTAYNGVLSLHTAGLIGEVRLRKGTYLFSTPPNAATASGLKISGLGKGVSIIDCGFAVGNLLIGTSYFDVGNLSITSSVVRSGGSYIRATGIRNKFHDLFLEKYATGIEHPTGAILNISNVECRDGVNSSGGIVIGDTTTGPFVEAVLFNVVMDAASTSPDYGIKLGYVDAVNIIACDIIRHGKDLWIAPQTGLVASSIEVIGTYLDSAVYGCLIEPAAGATVQFVTFTGSWASSNSQHGIYVVPGTGAIKGLRLFNHEGCLNTGRGLFADTGTQNVRAEGGTYAGNGGDGITIAGGVSNVKIKNNVIGPSDNQPGNTGSAIAILAGAGDFIEIVGNDVRGNGATINNGATGTNNRITDNMGYNTTPVGAAIAVGASPFAYKAGPSPETVYIAGGTVSNISVGGIAAFTQTEKTVELAPNETVTVTYSSVPFMNRVRH